MRVQDHQERQGLDRLNETPHTIFLRIGDLGRPDQTEGIDLRLAPMVADQELATGSAVEVKYWEGSVRVEGQDRGRPVRG